eukprot:scaffold2482_cov166-Amphora_coffeaeformis.AAC.12
METLDKILHVSARKLMQVGEALGFQNLDPDAGKIFITGATGVIGHRVAQRILESGYQNVRLGAHKPTSLDDLHKFGAEVSEFDWDREDTYVPALRGVKSVLCTIPYKEGWSTHFPAFLEACKESGVKHIVKLSFYHANNLDDPFQAVPLVREHGKCDEELVNMVVPPVEITPVMAADADVTIEFHHTRMSYTILYASHLMSNPFTLQGKELRDSMLPSTFLGASHGHGINYVSPNDLAEVAVRCLLEPRAHYDKEYTITGPGAVTDEKVAALLTQYLEKPITYVDQPLRIFSNTVKVVKEQKWMAEDLAGLEKIKATGKEEDPSFVSSDFEDICGHPPESFAEYLGRTEVMVPVEEAHATSKMDPLAPIVAA